MTLAAGVRGVSFKHFKYHNAGSCNAHRYSGYDYIDSSKFLSGSTCTAFSYSGTHLWGEHHWCSTSYYGQLWIFGCSAPYSTSHLLIINHDSGGMQTRVYNSGDYYKESDIAFEMFYNELL